MKSGTTLIYEERKEQIEKHGFTLEHDITHGSNQLSEAAIASIHGAYGEFPSEWQNYTPESCTKICKKPYLARLIIAGALIAAEIDRIQQDVKEDLKQ